LYGEGCPTSILEAFTFSVPVVAYKIDGIPELVEDGVDGLLFQPGNFKKLAKGIISLLSNPERIKVMGSSGKRKVEKHFVLDEMVKKHNVYFSRLK
jgi:glycosyltransferase involved in cell wall biosynthesis